jgi:hypothetical protein
LKAHPDVVFTGLCDVDSNALDKVSKEHPEAFTCRDFHEGFEKHADKFDAVLVCTPDHNHALVDITALKAGKHVYGTETAGPATGRGGRDRDGDQGASQPGDPSGQPTDGRRRSPDRARHRAPWRAGQGDRSACLGGWTTEGTKGYFWYGGLQDPTPPPPNIDWPLWLGAATDAPHRPGLIGLQWRSSWDYGTGQLGDWCTHLLDLIYFAYDLPSPIAVQCDTHAPSDFYHRGS